MLRSSPCQSFTRGITVVLRYRGVFLRRKRGARKRWSHQSSWKRRQNHANQPPSSSLYCIGRSPLLKRAGIVIAAPGGMSRFVILPIVHLLPTTLVGSYPQPEWLIDRAKLAGRFPPRVRAKELWRIPEQFLEEAQNDAPLLAIRAQEAAGLDIVTDGEIRRESYSNRFATALEGVDLDNPGTALDRSGHPNPGPRVGGTTSEER